jgi:O-antigen/teichoic acid export membrane protein
VPTLEIRARLCCWFSLGYWPAGQRNVSGYNLWRESECSRWNRVSTFKVFSRHVLTVGFSGISGQVVTLACLPLLSRLYAPHDFGEWTLITTSALLVGSVATLRYELAIVLPHHNGPAAALVWAGMTIAGLVSGVAAILLVPIANFTIGQEEVIRVGWTLWTIPTLIFFIATLQLGLAWCTRRVAFTTYAIGTFLLPTATAIAQLAGPWAGLQRSDGLIFGTLAGYAAAAFSVWLPILARDRGYIFRALSINRITTTALRFRQYPCYMTPYTLAGMLRDRSIYFLIGHFADPAAVGRYAMAQRLTSMPNNFISSAVRPVFFQQAARQKLSELAKSVFTIMVVLIGIAVPGMVVFWFHAEAVLGFLLGSQWSATAPYAVILSVPALPLLLGNWLDRVFDVSGRQRIAFLLESGFSFITLVALLLGFVVFKEVRAAVIAQAAAMTAYYWIWINVVFRLSEFPGSRFFQLLGIALGLTAVYVAVLWCLEMFFPLAIAVGVYSAIALLIGGFFAYQSYSGVLSHRLAAS